MDYEKKEKKEAIAFDFLGVLAKHNGRPFESEEKYTESDPNIEVVSAMKVLQEKGYKIVIHSTVANQIVEKYCIKHNIPFDEINDNSDYETGHKGKPVAKVYVDDRAVLYSGQNSEELANEIINFQPYWK